MKRSPLLRSSAPRRRVELARSPLSADPDKVREFQRRGRKASAKSLGKPRTISPASPAQRAKVRDRLCVNCAGLGPCDPAHLTPRSQGGCDNTACVIPLCRDCHRLFDEGLLDLEAVLALPDYATERSHMALHMSLRRCIQRLTGRRLIDGDPL